MNRSRLVRTGTSLLVCFVAVLGMRAGAGENALPAESRAGAESLAAGERLAAKGFRVAASRVRPSLVYIETFGGIPQDQGGIGGIRRPGDGPTTGLIIAADGYIVTSTFNFIRKPPIITVHLPDGTQHLARLLGQDLTRKICVLKIDAQNLPVPQMVDADQLKIGQWAVAVGVGFGDKEPAISAGIVSATNRIKGRAVQTDAKTSPANYGGPLVDIEGRVIGVCVPLSPTSNQEGSGVEWYDSGIGFAIPLDDARLLARLKQGTTIRGGFLGIQVQSLPGKEGQLIVTRLSKDSPAQSAGLKVGDQILTVDGQEIVDERQLRGVIAQYVEGEKILLVALRDQERLRFSIQLAARGAETKGE